jgi:hypothetical protein
MSNSAEDEMVKLQDLAKATMGLGLVYWFLWWCVPAWLGFRVYIWNCPEWVAWSVYGLAILAPMMMSNATLLYIEWRSRRRRAGKP